ncbi:MAG: hypothetical protein WAT79_00270 [Saprospiraceae bacterium]
MGELIDLLDLWDLFDLAIPLAVVGLFVDWIKRRFVYVMSLLKKKHATFR